MPIRIECQSSLHYTQHSYSSLRHDADQALPPQCCPAASSSFRAASLVRAPCFPVSQGRRRSWRRCFRSSVPFDRRVSGERKTLRETLHLQTCIAKTTWPYWCLHRSRPGCPIHPCPGSKQLSNNLTECNNFLSEYKWHTLQYYKIFHCKVSPYEISNNKSILSKLLIISRDSRKSWNTEAMFFPRHLPCFLCFTIFFFDFFKISLKFFFAMFFALLFGFIGVFNKLKS